MILEDADNFLQASRISSRMAFLGTLFVWTFLVFIMTGPIVDVQFYAHIFTRTLTLAPGPGEPLGFTSIMPDIRIHCFKWP